MNIKKTIIEQTPKCGMTHWCKVISESKELDKMFKQIRKDSIEMAKSMASMKFHDDEKRCKNLAEEFISKWNVKL